MYDLTPLLVASLAVALAPAIALRSALRSRSASRARSPRWRGSAEDQCVGAASDPPRESGCWGATGRQPRWRCMAREGCPGRL